MKNADKDRNPQTAFKRATADLRSAVGALYRNGKPANEVVELVKDKLRELGARIK